MKLSTTRAAKLWRRTALTTAVLMSLSALSTTVNSSEPKRIGDLEIYQSLLSGRPNLMIMIDVSASMQASSVVNDYSIDCSGSSYKIISGAADQVHVKVGGEEIVTFSPYGCQRPKSTSDNQTSIGNDNELDRLSRVQITLMSLFADEVYIGNGGQVSASTARLLPNEYAMGIGIFGYEPTGEKAKILSLVGQLDSVKRKELIRTISNLRSATQDTSTNTTQMGVSISSALTEAGAYMMGTTPYSAAYQNYTGFLESAENTKANSKYNSPPVTECSGKGIFVLTDNGPKKAPTPPANTAITSLSITKGKMNLSLGSTSAINTCSALGGSDTAWSCMGEYAQMLRSPSNPIREPIKTATAGIGKAFNIFSTTTQNITVDGKSVKVADCSAGTSTDAQNLCKLGELKANAATAYGNGKFYPIAIDNLAVLEAQNITESQYYATQIKNSIADFASGLSGIGIASPAGTITVPNNPYQVSEQLAFAYLPMLQPNISSTASIWKGNLKKYQLNNGTLYGNNNEALYNNIAGDLKKTTKDIWQSADFTPVGTTTVDNSSIKAGGVYAQLTTPTSEAGSVRTVYVEDIAADNKPVLRKLSVGGQGELVGFDTLIDPIYTEENKRRILSFLGFKSYIKGGVVKPLLDINGSKPSDDNELAINMVLKKPTEAVRVLGGVVHSKPTAISYSADLDANGRITSTREDYAIFGSMDGALHMAKEADGTEQFAIIPKKMIAEQSLALVDDSTKGAVGQPYFGVDAPWLVTTDYTYSLATTETATSKVTVDTSVGNGMFAYGGLRMGGEALYGINITNKDAPTMMFAITPSTAGFGRMGQTWSKPTAAKIRTSQSGNPIDVLVFGGGYDMQYESDTYKAIGTAPAKGNSIYIVNANSGELIWSASKSGSNTNNDDMIHSITGSITVLDRDNDGLMDHIYAADLGGQVFRADFQNARPAKFGFAEVSGFSNKRVVRILDTNSTGNPATYRFYERPVVSFYRNESISNEIISNAGKIFALVNVVSGDRSSPLSKVRSNNTYANRVYGIIDTDVTDSTLYDKTDTSLSIKDLTENSLLNLNTEIEVTALTTADALQTKKTTARNKLIRGTNKGWYYPLTRFDGYQGVKYNKGIGESMVINSLLYTTVYNPDKMYTAPQSCTTSILGGSERQVYCLPYGICSDANSKNGTGGYVPAGQGIQELTLGAFNSSNTDVKVLIGTRTLTDRINPTNRIAYGVGDTISKYYDPNSTNQNKLEAFANLGSNVGGDGSAVEYLFSERYTLQPKTWYERK